MAKEIIGPKIKRIRKERGLTQEQLAESLGYSHKSVITHIEKGDADMTYDKILQLIRTYMIDANELFEVEKIDQLILENERAKKKPKLTLQQLRMNLKEVSEAVIKDKKVVTVATDDGEFVMIAKDEYDSLLAEIDK